MSLEKHNQKIQMHKVPLVEFGAIGVSLGIQAP
jgi:hypothetical protein